MIGYKFYLIKILLQTNKVKTKFCQRSKNRTQRNPKLIWHRTYSAVTRGICHYVSCVAFTLTVPSCGEIFEKFIIETKI